MGEQLQIVCEHKLASTHLNYDYTDIQCEMLLIEDASVSRQIQSILLFTSQN